jgi:hypothetical protein
MAAKQQKLDFDRAAQLALLRDVRLPPSVGSGKGRVSAASLKAVLRAIDDFGRGREAYPSVQTIALVAGLGARTVKRAIHALQHDLGLLIVERRKATYDAVVNHYRIVWSELAVRCLRDEPGAAAAPGSADQGAAVSDQGAAVSNQGAAAAPKALISDLKRSPPPTPETESTSSAWGVVEKLLAHVGLVEHAAATAAARARGLSPEQVIEIVNHWQTFPPGRWSDALGVLYHRLVRASPAWNATEGWPPPRPEFATAQAREHALATTGRAREQFITAAEAARRRDAELETRWGPVLDAMPADALQTLAAEVLKDGALDDFRRQPHGFWRPVVLAHLSQREPVTHD